MAESTTTTMFHNVFRSSFAPFLLSAVLCVAAACKRGAVAPTPLVPSQYQFKLVDEQPSLPVLDQGTSGTCWAFTMASFLESEIIRQSGRRIDLSEMYLVRNTYVDKAQTHLWRRGQTPFSEGALNPDAIITASRYGLVPQATYTGLGNGQTRHDHRELFAGLEGVLKKYVGWEYKGVGWKADMTLVLDQYLGPDVPTFSYENKSFTPASFLQHTGLKPAEYVHLTSFTHRPFYQPITLDVPWNFSNEPYLNVPLDEWAHTISAALDRGFTVAVELDVSEPTFSGDYGVGVIPDGPASTTAILYKPAPEKAIDATYRQQEFENYHTTNDHNLHIVGRVSDQQGKVYYKAKNSWSTKSGREGFMYLSEAYVRLKVIYYTVHRDALLPATKSRFKL